MSDKLSDATATEPPLKWTYETDQIPSGGLTVKRDATAGELAALAAALDIIGCEKFHASYRVTRAADDGYRLKGKLIADVVQACVVTLAPVLETVSADFAAEFRPATELAGKSGGNVELDDESEMEPIEGNMIDVGRVIYEELAAGLNPYPRRPGAEFSPVVDKADDGRQAKANPFAVLAKLKAND